MSSMALGKTYTKIMLNKTLTWLFWNNCNANSSNTTNNSSNNNNTITNSSSNNNNNTTNSSNNNNKLCLDEACWALD